MLTDDKLNSMKHDYLQFGAPSWKDAVELIDEIKRLRHELRVKDAEIEDVRGNNMNLRAELSRYTTPNVDNIEVKS